MGGGVLVGGMVGGARGGGLMGREREVIYLLDAFVFLLLRFEALAGGDGGLEVLEIAMGISGWKGLCEAGRGVVERMYTCLELLIGVGELLELLLVVCHCLVRWAVEGSVGI